MKHDYSNDYLSEDSTMKIITLNLSPQNFFFLKRRNGLTIPDHKFSEWMRGVVEDFLEEQDRLEEFMKNDPDEVFCYSHIFTCNFDKKTTMRINKAIREGFFMSRSEMLRHAVRKRLLHEMDLKNFSVINMKFKKKEEDPSIVKIPNGDGTFEKRKIVRRLD